jgi:hypothetical protein
LCLGSSQGNIFTRSKATEFERRKNVMKGSDVPQRTDVILAVVTLTVALVAVGAIVATGVAEEFVAWAWARHHNVLSWYVRPLFILPFCFFAYRRSLFGIVLTLLALATSMFWFPAPEHASPAVNEMLGAEEAYLTTDWTLWKVLIALLIPLTFAALGLSFWKRSLVWGLAVVNAAIIFKIAWTFLFSTEAGAMSHLPAAVLGLAVCDALILFVMRRMRARSSYERGRPGEHHGQADRRIM